MYGPRLMEFVRSMEPAKEMFTAEILEFAKQYDFLGEMTIDEMPDLETLDYLYTFEVLNGTSKEKVDSTLVEIYDYMEDFTKKNGIYEFFLNMAIFL